MGSYEYLEDEAIADVAFKALGNDLNDLFYQAGIATAHLQTDITLIDQTEQISLNIRKSSLDRLLKEFLGEILYYKDSDLIFATDFDINVEKDGEDFVLKGVLKGGIFDFNKHPMHNDLKAITWHNLYVRKTEEGWECYVLIDI